MFEIEQVHAREVLDSRGNPTVEAEVELEDGRRLRARLVVGADTGPIHLAASLGVPTATSVRSVPVKLLEENRRLINHHQATIAGPKISLTPVSR